MIIQFAMFVPAGGKPVLLRSFGEMGLGWLAGCKAVPFPLNSELCHVTFRNLLPLRSLHLS